MRVCSMTQFFDEQRYCRKCGCTQEDCSQCIQATGAPCYWVESDLCSRCDDELREKTFKGERPVSYDNCCRMRYHPDYHAKHGTPWTNHDEKYLIENYEKDGPEAVSLVLERTIHLVMTRAYTLRRRGKMPKRTSTTTHRRSRCEEYA